MGYAKIWITLDPKAAAELRAVAGRGGLSAFVNDAVRQKLQAVRSSCGGSGARPLRATLAPSPQTSRICDASSTGWIATSGGLWT